MSTLVLRCGTAPVPITLAALTAVTGSARPTGAELDEEVLPVLDADALPRLIVLGDDAKLETKLLIAREVLVVREPLGTVKGAKIDVSSAKEAHYIPNTLPTITPVPTATPTIAPSATPET